MSSEKRLVRPYVGLERFQNILDKWYLRIADEILEPGDHRTVTSSSFLTDPAVLVCATDDDALEDVHKEAIGAVEAVDLSLADVELIVLASTPYLRMADIALRQSLADDEGIPRTLNLAEIDGLRAQSTPNGGCNIDVYFALAQDTPARPLHPWRRGTWFGHIRFSLGTDLGELGFTPRALTDLLRNDMELPANTIRHVVIDDDALRGEDLAGAVELYIDETLLAMLNQSPNTSAARSFQRQVFIDVVGAIVRATGRWPDLPDVQLTDIEDTVLGRIVWAAAGPGRRGESSGELTARRQQALDWLKRRPEHFVSLIESSCAPRDDWRHAIGGLDA